MTSLVQAVPLLALVEAEGPGPINAAEGAIAALTWPMLLLPLAGFALLIFGGRRLGEPLAGWVGTAIVGLSFLLGIGIFAGVLGAEEGSRRVVVDGYTWLAIADLELTTALLIDPLSATLLLVVTGVGSLIHLYSLGYMHGDPRFGRYFAYLNLFIFSMLLLILAENLVVMFVGWELVGLCSYLLIGFWFEQRANSVAAKKAFIVNRVGDVSFSIGLFLIFSTFGALAMSEVLPQAAEVLDGRTSVAVAIGLLLLGGAVGKSAQIPLYVWLPDAMAGPTPVSALIHAATMVTAGVYMVARLSPIYVMGPGALEVVAIVGAATALLAALIAIQQDDIKMVLAYSTVSQLGYMFIGVGVGAFGVGIFHLVTHAFFKALLFLAAGSVMHAMADRTNMWGMGGLRHAMPWTFWTSVVAVAAIAGVPPFAGFFSKDLILEGALTEGHTIIYVIGVVTAGLTAFYMARWLIVPFLGRPRYDTDELHPHESPWTMAGPLVVLAVLSLGAGFLNPSHGGPLEQFLAPAFATGEEGEMPIPEALHIAIAVAVAAIGIAAAWVAYRDAPRHDPLPARLGAFSTAMREKFWVNELYEEIFVRGGGAGARFLEWFDVTVIDGAVNGVASGTRKLAQGARQVQPGLVRMYVAGMVLGTLVIIGAFLAQVVI